MPHKSEFTVGLERLLNNPQVNFFGNSSVFRELQSVTKQNAGDLLREVGKKTRAQNDNQRSAKRLETMKERQTEKTEK